MQQIITLLNWTALEHSQFIYDSGMQYLRHYIPADQEGIAALERSRIFWNWWKNHWQQRDRKFLHIVNHNASAVCIRKFYTHYHNPRKLAGQVWPNAVVLNESYARMINQFNDEVLTK